MNPIETAMGRAAELADNAVGLSSPNPPVGAVVLGQDGAVIGSGYTQEAGGPHAEVMALRTAGAAARGATLVCTLEPCAHTGRTGPCASAIIEAGIATVAYAVADPNPVAAGGARVLRDAGITVQDGVRRTEVEAGALRPWLHVQRTGRPLVTWKAGQSLDGQVAAEDGSSQWITSPEARADVHELRGRVDAILAGAGTVRRDDPRLTVRDGDTPRTRQPLRVVLSSGGGLPETSAVFDGSTPTLLAVGPGASHDKVTALRGKGIDVWVSPGSPAQGADLEAMMAELARRGVLHLLIEGGPTTAGSFLTADLVDEAVVYIAPKLLLSGMWPALRGYGVSSIDEAIDLAFTDVEHIGPDLRVTAVPQRR